jgi:hypothetical protein
MISNVSATRKSSVTRKCCRCVHIIYYEPGAPVLLQGFGFNEDIYRTIWKGQSFRTSCFSIHASHTETNRNATLKNLPSVLRSKHKLLEREQNGTLTKAELESRKVYWKNLQKRMEWSSFKNDQNNEQDYLISEQMFDGTSVSCNIKKWTRMYDTLKERSASRVAFLAYKDILGPLAVNRFQARKKLRLACQRILPEILNPGVDLVFKIRSPMLLAQLPYVQSEMFEALVRFGPFLRPERLNNVALKSMRDGAAELLSELKSTSFHKDGLAKTSSAAQSYAAVLLTLTSSAQERSVLYCNTSSSSSASPIALVITTFIIILSGTKLES